MIGRRADVALKAIAGDIKVRALTSDYGPPSKEGYYDEMFAVPTPCWNLFVGWISRWMG